MNERSDSGAGAPEGADVLADTLKVSPETARAAAENADATGMRKPGPNEVDEARAARARATEPGEDGEPHP